MPNTSKKTLVSGNTVFVYDILGNLLMVIARDAAVAETQVPFPGYSNLESAGRAYLAIVASFRGESFNLNQIERQLAAANADVATAMRIMAEAKAVNPTSIFSPVEMPAAVHDAIQAAAIAFKEYCRENGITLNGTSPYAVASKQLFRLLSLDEAKTWAYDVTTIVTAIAAAFVTGWAQIKPQLQLQIEQQGVDAFRTEIGAGAPHAQGASPAGNRRALAGAGAQG